MTHASHVLIRGHVFTYEEKAPFVVSGNSVLAAIEYDPATEKVKCHECGGWFDAISRTHLSHKHQISTAIYKFRHGINQTTGLCTPSFSRMRAAQNPVAGNPKQTALLIEAGREHKRLHGNNLVNRSPQKERFNADGKCQAQVLFRVQVMAAELGRTPTSRELQGASLAHLMTRYFGGLSTALVEAGLQLRELGDVGMKKSGGLPAGFPSKEKLMEERMPWPKEYFGTRPPSTGSSLRQ